MSRVAICGVPKAGKTTLANTLARAMGVPFRSTDDLMHMPWSEASERAATWFDAPGDVVIEGVAVCRALRKWLRAHPTGKPCDELVVLDTPVVAVKKGQESMGKGVMTVLAEIQPELKRRGVRVTRGKAPPRSAA